MLTKISTTSHSQVTGINGPSSREESKGHWIGDNPTINWNENCKFVLFDTFSSFGRPVSLFFYQWCNYQFKKAFKVPWRTGEQVWIPILYPCRNFIFTFLVWWKRKGHCVAIGFDRHESGTTSFETSQALGRSFCIIFHLMLMFLNSPIFWSLVFGIWCKNLLNFSNIELPSAHEFLTNLRSRASLIIIIYQRTIIYPQVILTLGSVFKILVEIIRHQSIRLRNNQILLLFLIKKEKGIFLWCCFFSQYVYDLWKD